MNGDRSNPEEYVAPPAPGEARGTVSAGAAPARAPVSVPADEALRRRLAEDARHSYLVEAPAGSGKTELLLRRYLTLLGTVEDPRSVLAITFTRKAAGEIRERVLAALREAQNPASQMLAATRAAAGAALAAGRRWGWNLLQQPQWLQIQTIDSLCQGLARRRPGESGLGGEREMLDEAGAQAAYATAVRNLLRQIAGPGETGAWMRQVILHADNRVEWLERQLIAMLGQRDQWLPSLGASRDLRDAAAADAIRHSLEANWSRHIAGQLRQLRAALPDGLGARMIGAMNYAARQLAGNKPEFAAWRERHELPETAAEDLPLWQAMADLFLTKEGGWRKILDKRQGFPAGKEHKAAKEQCLELLRVLPGQDELLRALARIQLLPAARYDDLDWAMLRTLALLLPRAAAELSHELARRRQADFVEMALAALRALGEEEAPNDLAYQVDCRLRHVLVDEMQDTAPAQLALLRRLTAGWAGGDGRTVFFVGDPKQSIYGFRDADARLFRRCQASLAHLNIAGPERLQVNFRSAPHLIQWVNQVFAGVFPSPEGELAGAVEFAGSQPAPNPPISEYSQVDFTPIFYDDAMRLSRNQEEAEKIVACIRQIQSRDGSDASIAVLVRVKDHAAAILAALQAQGIAYDAVALASLGERSLIQDLRALVRALLYPADRTAWLAALRAPWCGLTLEDLTALCEDDGGSPIAGALPAELLALRRDRLSADGQARLRRMLPVLEQARQSRGSLRQRVEAAWIGLGGPACLGPNREEDEACLQAFWKLLESAETSGELSQLAAWEEQLNRLYAPPREAASRLKILTVHKAKGLEFDYVILPRLQYRPRHDDVEPLMLEEVPDVDNRGQPQAVLPLLAVNLNRETGSHASYLAHLRKLQDAEERKRVLYVAATRAKKQLFLSAQVSVKNGTAEQPGDASLLRLLWPVLRSECAERARTWQSSRPVVPAAVVASDGRLPSLHRLPLAWRLPAPPASILPPRSAAPLGERPSFDWAGDAVRLAGIVAHRWLGVIHSEGLSAWNAGRVEKLIPRFESDLREAGVVRGEVEPAGQWVKLALINTLQDERGRWLLQRHEADHSEWDLGGFEAGDFLQIRPDRCFVEGGERWIVDYKLSQHAGGEEQVFLDEQKRRYRPQLLRYAQLVRILGPQTVRLGLYFPLLRTFLELALPDDGEIDNLRVG